MARKCKCGAALIEGENWYISSKERNAYWCKKCIKDYNARYSLNNRLKIRKTGRAWEKANPIMVKSKWLLNHAKKRSIEKEVELNLTREWIVSRLENGMCEATGIKFDMRVGIGKIPFAPSIDRINSSLGYTEDNCRLVIWLYNAAKQEFADEDVLIMARSIVARSDSMLQPANDYENSIFGAHRSR